MNFLMEEDKPEEQNKDDKGEILINPFVMPKDVPKEA